MSKRAVESLHDSEGMAGPSMHPNQSSWMAHWMQTSHKSAPQAYNIQHPSPIEREIASSSKSAKGFRGVTDASPVKIKTESVTSSNDLRKQSIDCHSFPMFNLNQNRESVMRSKNDQLPINLGTKESHLPTLPARDPPEIDNSFRGYCFQPEGTSENLAQLEKSQYFLQKNRLAIAASRSFRGDFLGSTSNVHRLDSNIASKEHFINATATHLEHERGTTFVVRQEKINSCLKSRTSGTSFLRQNDGALLPHDPSTSNYQTPDLFEEPNQKTQNQSVSRFFASRSSPSELNKSESSYRVIPDLFEEPNQKTQNQSVSRFFASRSSPPELNKSESSYQGCYPLQKIPFSVHDVETMRICTTVNSVKGMPVGPSRYSHTMHHMLITRKTDVNMSDGLIFKESTASNKFKGKTFMELLSLSPPNFGSHSRPGLNLQPLDTSTDSEGKENVGHVKSYVVDSKNESSAETDTMDMEAFQEKYHLSDLALSVSNKENVGEGNVSSSQANLFSNNEKLEGRLPHTELPDINEPAAANSMGNGEPSTSTTQSLDMDRLLSNAAHPASSKSIISPVGTLGPEPSSRWVKRLKMSGSDSFAHGTNKSSKMGEASYHEKANSLNKILIGRRTSTEPTSDTHCGDEQMELNQTAMLKNGESSALDSVKTCEDVTLSHSWIRRWCRNQAASPQKNPKAVVICEPQSSKAAFEDFPNRHFPSIGAMALMGKAMNGFHPCEFRKRGSFVVWNTKEF